MSAILGSSVTAVLAILCSLLTAVLLAICLSTDHWEEIVYERNLVIAKNSSTVKVNADTNSYIEVMVYSSEPSIVSNVTLTNATYYLYPEHGGVWQVCDYLTDEERGQIYPNASNKRCFSYIDDYDASKVTENGLKWLIRMQNSVSSWLITCVLVLLTTVITGSLGLCMRQVSIIMVTGTMYILIGVFLTFGLACMHAKIDNEQSNCFTLRPLDESLCSTRIVSSAWGLILAWFILPLSLGSSALWLYLTRLMRIEKQGMLLQ